jgi:hypothetical protein
MMGASLRENGVTAEPRQTKGAATDMFSLQPPRHIPTLPVTIGEIILFSTETGDAWLIEPSDQLAAQLARDGDPEPFHIEESETTFTIDWKGRYRIEEDAFVYMDRETGRLATIHGYPTHKLIQKE